MGSWYQKIRVTHLDVPEERAKFRAFAGTVEEVVHSKTDDTILAWKGKNVIGITANSNMAVGEIIDNHAISRIVVLPENSKIATQYIVNNTLRLCRTIICENMHLRTVENEAVVIIAGSMGSAVPYLQWLLIKGIRIILYLPPTENGDDEKYVEEHDYKHGLFNHPQFKPVSANGALNTVGETLHAVIIRRKPVGVISEDVLTLTNGMGASAVTVLPDAIKEFKAAEVHVSRQTLLAAGIGCRIVWHQALEQVDPCEAKCLFDKSGSLEFFNFDATLESHGADGLVQHALLETVKRATHNTIYVER
ncbi:urease accessory ureD, putative [Babesia ovata]|uniref:Urease accessory ureD, putative n=1 Tax=Babesia ovata TaxID=189622 RepID=A0A2H6KCM1_9APIC|nr:urease accessory ureD, putative [Babesia ovata]GBE60724.1 urease accessory ureD, putative [Babesia ovata]